MNFCSQCTLAFLIFLQFGVRSASAQSLLVPSDQSYWTTRDSRSLYIAPQSYRTIGPNLLPNADYFHQQYEKSFQWQLDELSAIVLASPRNQIANGATFVNPNTETIFYPSPGNMQDLFAVKSWLYVLLAHEMAHLYQLNPRETTPSILKTALGNPSFLLFFPVPVFPQPNILLPVFLLEGNAVLNESRFGMGGRLYSGEIRALFLQLLKNQQVTLERLINDHLEFPFQTEKYYVGGYFQAFLADKFGIDKVNSFFQKNSIHWINPLLLNETFLRTFGTGYEELIEEFKKTFRPLAEQQKSSTAPSLAFGTGIGLLNADADRIFFVLQRNLKSRNRLALFDKKTQQLSIERRDLEVGKAFHLADEYAAVGSIRDSVHTIRYGLYARGRKPLRRYQSQIVQDIRANKTLTIDASRSFVESRLYINGEFLNTTASTAILSDQGEAYYFQQHGLERVLFRDKKEILRFPGFYSRPLEVLPDGRVLFLSSTPTGSTIFAYDKGKVVRLSDLDTITDARMIDTKKALVIEVSDRGYDARIVEIQEKTESPAQYHYQFESAPEYQTFQGPITDSLATPSGGSPSRFQRSYFEPFQLRYSATSLMAFMSNLGPVGSANVNFTDPLQYNQINVNYVRNAFRTNSVEASYSNTRHRLNYSLGYLYDEDVVLDTSNVVFDRHYDHTAYLDLAYPLFVWRRWTGSLQMESAYESLDHTDYINFTFPRQRNLGFFGAFNLKYLESYPQSFAPYRLLSLTAANKILLDADTKRRTDEIYTFRIQGNIDIYDEDFVSFSGGSGFATNHNIVVDDAYALHVTPFSFTTLFPGFATRALQVQEAQMGFQKVINWGFYFYQIPLSLRRLAPFARAQYLWLRERVNDGPADRRFWLYEAGTQFELLLVHRLPFKLSVSYIADTLKRTSDGLAIGLSTQLTF